MLMYGDAFMANNIVPLVDKMVVYNLSSLNERFPRINLIPPNTLGTNFDLAFDINYANWILCNEPVFNEYMKIISALNTGYNVYIVISKEDWSINLVESLTKLIQERYGITSIFIESYEDYLCANDSEASEGMGLYNLQQDMERYSYMNYNNLKNGVSEVCFDGSSWKNPNRINPDNIPNPYPLFEKGW